MDQPLSLSFEFFPPKTESAVEKLLQVADGFAPYQPEFFSVTFGAGGSTQQHTPNTVASLTASTAIDVAPHISCVSSTKQEILSLLEHYQRLGVRRLVVLRGDKPSGFGLATGELKYASDLVALIRQTTGDHFDIDVAAYTECHPEAHGIAEDVSALKQKVAAGANRAITPIFF